MEDREINLLWLYPDILSLHGDRGNIMAFERIASKLGLKINVNRVNTFDESIDFKSTDIIFLCPGELKVMRTIVEALSIQLDEIKEYVESGKYVFAIGTSAAILANETLRKNGEAIAGLGLLDMECKERENILGDDIYYTINDGKKQEIIGSQIQVVDTILNTAEPLAVIKYGYGNNGTGVEGARYKNIIFTNALGPVFVKNPWWVEEILDAENNMDDAYEIEKLSFETIKKFIQEKQG